MRSVTMVLLALGMFLCSGCGDVVDYQSATAPAPVDDAHSSKIQLRWVDWDDDEPEPGSHEAFNFVVELTNHGRETFEWPDPCPTYHWSWGESATEYGAGFGYLNCANVPSLPPGEAQEFRIEVPAAEDTGASTLLWELVDPRSCNFMTMGFDRGQASDPGPSAGDLGCGDAY